MKSVIIGLAAAGSLWAMATQAMPAPLGPTGEPGLLCRSAIQQAEMGSQLPKHMLSAIGRVESGRPDPVTGHVHPWPWTINAQGQGKFFETKAEAVAFTRQLQAQGVQSIDVGCMQINLMHHPDAFHSLDEAFDPASNARYAVTFLSQLREKTGNWETASAWYHSANPEEGNPYREKIVTAMQTEARDPTSYAALPMPRAAVWPVAASGLPGIFAGRGGVVMLPRTTNGVVLARPNPMVVGPNGSMTSMPMSGAVTASGRGLDAYRMQPVRVVSLGFVAAR
jgi:hypothetical protein